MKNFILFFSGFFLFACALNAEGLKKFPNISGDVLFQIQADRVLSTQKRGVSANNAFVYIEPNLVLNFNRNWAVKTQWRLQPNDVLTTRNTTYPERYRTFLQSNRSVNIRSEERRVGKECRSR